MERCRCADPVDHQEDWRKLAIGVTFPCCGRLVLPWSTGTLEGVGDRAASPHWLRAPSPLLLEVRRRRALRFWRFLRYFPANARKLSVTKVYRLKVPQKPREPQKLARFCSWDRLERWPPDVLHRTIEMKRAQSYPRSRTLVPQGVQVIFRSGPAQASAHSISPVRMREDRETAEPATGREN